MSRNKRATRVRYDKLVPQDTFLGDFLSYMEGQETSHAYDFWAGCWLLSVACGRSIIVDRPRAPVYLNLFCIFVAESGITRKSSAVREGVRFARELCNNPVPLLVESKLTPEKLEYDLHEQTKLHGQASCAIAISELVTFLGREKYVETMPTLLTDLYDCPEIKTGGGSLSRGKTELRNVFVSFLSASTPSWLLRAVNPDVIEGGFTSRVMFIVSEQPKAQYSWPEEADDKRRSRIKEYLDDIRQKSAAVQRIAVSESARKSFDRWYKSRSNYYDPFRSSFQSREDAHILRLAGLLCINDNTWVIQHTHIVTAIKIITEVREDGASIFEGAGSNGRLVLGIDKLRDKLLAAGISGIPQRELTKITSQFFNADYMKTVLDIMHDLGMVQRFENIQLGRGRPMTLWRATQALAASKALDRIIDATKPQ